jgi:hypothetical protein
MATKHQSDPILFQEPMRLDKMIGILMGLRSSLPGDTIVHLVFQEDELTPITMDVGKLQVVHYTKILSAIRFTGQQF